MWIFKIRNVKIAKDFVKERFAMSYEMIFRNAVELHEAGQLDKAEALYRQILETVPGQPEVLNLLGLVAQAKGAQTEACRLFMLAIKAKPQEASFYFNLAFSFKLDGKPIEALENFRKVIQLAPAVKEAYNEIALLLQQNGQIDEARQNWQYVIQLDANYAEAKANLAMSYREENIVRAIDELQRLSAEFPSEARIFYYLTQLYMQRDMWDKAWPAAVRAKELAPVSDEIRVLLALLSAHDGQPENAKIYFAKAEMLNPNNIAALMGLADLYSREGNFAEAEPRYKRVLELEAKNFDAHNNYAEMLQRQGRLAEALEEYRAAVIINPAAAEVSNNLGLILRSLGEYDEALGLFFNAFARKPEMEEISVNISETITLLSYEDMEKALAIAENWKNNSPQNAFAIQTAAALKGEDVGNNQIYSEKLFDHFADNYELVVKNLGYSVPLALGRIAGPVEGTVVDLGCGTGLVAAALKNTRNRFIGVDISQKMLDAAGQKKVYDRLVKSDAAEYLRQNQDFDWAVAADVLGYIGDLSEIIKLLKNKKIVFSVEALEEDGNYRLMPGGRYKHNPAYVEKLLRDNGFERITKEELVLRVENGNPVKGFIYKGE